MKKVEQSTPVYQQIAVDIAANIVNGKIAVHEKLYARSSLATKYGVSSETARRAIMILQDLRIVEATKGSGVTVLSKDNAATFVRQFQEVKSITDLQQEVQESVQRQANELEHFKSTLHNLIVQTERFQATNAFTPFKVEITKESPYVGKSIAELNFWHHTSATIVALRRKGELHVSPGPYAVLQEQDEYYFVGDVASIERVRLFLYPELEE